MNGMSLVCSVEPLLTDRYSDQQLGQLYELMQAIQKTSHENDDEGV